ncbi:hypothetical protein VNI00_019087 [Paramarasmius palmivorus]|uniref:Uncharacterized protein n=1 Tax=Paramarasmius palmivorus TaxID=297713 RepID=A0AAW0AR10_9AGAR
MNVQNVQNGAVCGVCQNKILQASQAEREIETLLRLARRPRLRPSVLKHIDECLAIFTAPQKEFLDSQMKFYCSNRDNPYDTNDRLFWKFTDTLVTRWSIRWRPHQWLVEWNNWERGYWTRRLVARIIRYLDTKSLSVRGLAKHLRSFLGTAANCPTIRSATTSQIDTHADSSDAVETCSSRTMLPDVEPIRRILSFDLTLPTSFPLRECSEVDWQTSQAGSELVELVE